MRAELVRRESLAEFFRCLVDEALTHQRLRVLDMTRYYLVQLLESRVRRAPGSSGSPEDEPLAIRLARALEAVGAQQRRELRGLADDALFVSGFFSDSLARSVVDVDYYASLGGHAYQQLGAFDSDTLAPAFCELGARFLAFADVLTEISEHSALTSDRDLLRLYERWVRHGSRRNEERLLRRGITPSVQAVQALGRVQ
jgi:hypothetical protein